MVEYKLPFLLSCECLRLFRIVDDCPACEHFLHTVRSHCRSWKHDGEHAQHQESHDDLHRVLDKRHHITHLHLTVIDAVCPRPYDEYGDTVHDQHHHRHHKCHGAVDEQVRLHQGPVRLVKTCFLVLLCAEGTDDRKSGQDLPHYKVDLIYKCLQYLELRHCDCKQDQNDKRDHYDCESDDPGHGHIRLEHLDHTANGKDRRVKNDTEQHDDNQLDLLDIVRASGNQGSRGEMVELIIREPDHLAEYLSSQIASGCRADAGRKEPDKDTCRHSEECKPHHLCSCREQILELQIIHIHSQTFIRGSHIADGSLLEDHLREFVHLLTHCLHERLSLLIWHHFHNVKDSHAVNVHCFRHISGGLVLGLYLRSLSLCLELAFELFFQLLFDLHGHVAAGLKACGQHHRSGKQFFQVFHFLFVICDRFFQYICFCVVSTVICVISIQHGLLISLRHK